MARSRVVIKDRGAKALLARLQAVSKTRLTVGIHEDDGAKTYPGGQTVAEVATYNELGLGVPRRSFIADWVDETEEAKRADLRRAATAVIKGADLAARMKGLGANYVGQVRERMSQTQPDEPETVHEKGSSEPLDDTGLLRSNVKARVT